MTTTNTLVSTPVGGNGGGSFNLVCPDTTYITQFQGSSGQILDNIGIKCSDGSVLGQQGGSGGSAFTSTSASGYTGAQFTSTNFDNDNLMGDFTPITSSGVQGGYGCRYYKNCSGSPYKFTCPTGYLLSGLIGRSGKYVDNLTAQCAPVSQTAILDCCTGNNTNCREYQPGSSRCKSYMQIYCANSSNFASSACKLFCSDTSNKAFCDVNVTSQCAATNYSDPYCSCLKKMTSYPQYSTMPSIYNSLTECFVSDCTDTDAYKLGNIQCPSCVQLQNISGTGYTAANIQQTCDVGGSATNSTNTTDSSNTTPTTNSTNTTPTTDSTNTTNSTNITTSPLTSISNFFTNLSETEKISGGVISSVFFLFVIILLGYLITKK